jgi:hypothetical protein
MHSQHQFSLFSALSAVKNVDASLTANLSQSAGFFHAAGKACAFRRKSAFCLFCNGGDCRNRPIFAVRGRSAALARVE